MPKSSSGVTCLLHAWRDGDPEALPKLISLLYDDLHQMAQRRLARERAGHTLQPTALVNELCIRLMGEKDAEFNDRLHFLAIASQVMRRLLAEHARRRQRDKHGGRLERLSLAEVDAEPDSATAIDVLALHEALDRLASMDPRKSRLVELRYFGGLSLPEAAQVLGISETTVKREWLKAKAWLFSELHPEAME